MRLWLTGLLFLLAAGAACADEPVSTGRWSDTAIGGHDALAYHASYANGVTASAPVAEGSKKFVVVWQGAKWRFANQASADQFAADPRRYVPRYNGYCANALSLGEGLVRTDGSVWEFFGERLHLFYAEGGRQRWLSGDWQAYQAEADAAWQAQLPK